MEKNKQNKGKLDKEIGHSISAYPIHSFWTGSNYVNICGDKVTNSYYNSAEITVLKTDKGYCIIVQDEDVLKIYNSQLVGSYELEDEE